MAAGIGLNPNDFENLSSERVTTTEPGILIVYVDNQTMGKDVWFDNVQVLHYNTQVLEETHYYPFGLTLSTTAMGTTQQPLKYQGIELEKNFGLETYETFFRGLDPQLGRFNSVDPKAELDYGLSPFVSMRNNPVNMIDPLGDVAGDYYNRQGEFLYNDGKNDHKIYLVDKLPSVDGSIVGSGANVTTELKMNDVQFRQTANIVKQEGNSSDPNEYLYIAHTNNNEAKERGTDMHSLLMSSYSSVGDKSELSNSDKSATANSARAGVIDVLTSRGDPTKGATLWDGTDFLAWGLNSPNGTPHNKFEEYSSINIPNSVYNTFKNSNTTYYGGTVRYGRNAYSIPAAVFTNRANWTTGNFQYNTGVKSRFSLTATVSAGKSIFWKKTTP